MASPRSGVRGLHLLFELLIEMEFDDGFASFFKLGLPAIKTFAIRVDAPSYVLGSGGECYIFNNLTNNLEELMR